MSMMLAEERKRRVLGIASTGFPITAIRGSEGEDDGDNGEKEKETGTEGGGSGDGGGSTGSTNQTIDTAELQQQLDTLTRRLQAADKAKGEAEKRLREIDDADKSELEKAKRDLEDLKKRAERAEAEALQAKIAGEILKFPGFVWHDPEAVLRLVDMETISVDAETGKVTGVKDALNKLAKDKPYLLKGKQDGKEKSGGAGTNGASGHNPAGGGDTTDANKQRDKLRAKYKLR